MLHDLGLGTELAAASSLPLGIEIRHWQSGAILSASQPGYLTAWGSPYYHIHRADLIALLVKAVQAQANIRLYANATVTRVEQTANAVTLWAHDRPHHGGLLVGADGIKSLVRSALFGADQPRFTGNVAWRGLVPVDRLPEGLIRPVATLWWGPHKHFVHYYVRQGQLVNCVCVVEKPGWETESWTEPGDQAELQRDFAGWHDTIGTLIDNIAPDACYKWALFDRAPMPAWSQGNITLLGDACHPSLPFRAQGAALAIEDAAVLARCVDAVDGAPGKIEASLMRYENLRRQRTTEVQKHSRQNATTFHATGLTAWVRNRLVNRLSKARLDKLFAYDALVEYKNL